jgi:hypothetical protein
MLRPMRPPSAPCGVRLPPVAEPGVQDRFEVSEGRHWGPVALGSQQVKHDARGRPRRGTRGGT